MGLKREKEKKEKSKKKEKEKERNRVASVEAVENLCGSVHDDEELG